MCMKTTTSQKLSEAVRRREIVPHVCPECGTTFEAIKIAVYDKRACQVRAYRRRKRERRGNRSESNNLDRDQVKVQHVGR
jgi:hypothetical protein